MFVSGGPPCNAVSTSYAATSSVRSDLFCDRSRSQRENPAVNFWLAPAFIREKFPTTKICSI